MNNFESRIPVTLLTGFLGSGKTTLLNALVSTPLFENALIVINEFGEIGLDHLLMSDVTQSEQVIEMSNGCICCTIQGDLQQTLKDIHWRFSRQGKQVFDKVIIETTGLADPTPILHTLMTDEWLFDHYRLDGVLTTVDAVNGMNTLSQYPEAVKQVAMADCLLISKTDLLAPELLADLTERLSSINPHASTHISGDVQKNSELIGRIGLYDSQAKRLEALSWLNFNAVPAINLAAIGRFKSFLPSQRNSLRPRQNKNRHNDRIKASCFTFDKPFHPDFFDEWLSVLLGMTGDNVLRVKGIINVAGQSEPMVVHGVQHVFHPAVKLPQWPSDDRHSKIVFISRDTDPVMFERMFDGLMKYRDPMHKRT